MQLLSSNQADSERPSTVFASVWVRFFVFGFFNTVLTFGLFVGLGLIVSPKLAYGAAFLVGIIFVSFFSNRWVFKGSNVFPRRIGFAVWYLVIFAIGQVVIALVQPEGASELVWVSAALIAITVPLNFIGGRYIFGKGA